MFVVQKCTEMIIHGKATHAEHKNRGDAPSLPIHEWSLVLHGIVDGKGR